MLELLAAIVEAIVALVTALIEAIASLFTASASSLGLGELLLLALVALLELAWWAVLGIASLVVALVRWRRPRRVARPVFWRPKAPVSPSSEP